MSAEKARDLGALRKAPTGIEGFDEVTLGGLPEGRPTLIIGGPGSGKTLFAMEFLVNGATKFNEPGVFISFEETENDLVQNVASLGFDLRDLMAKNMLVIDSVVVDPSEIVETGEYDLEGLFVRLGYAIDSIKAKRVVLDTIESVFSMFSNSFILRSELRRLFRYLKEKGVTAVVTGEKGEHLSSRNGLEEYVSDAVVYLDNRVIENIATRRMRILKYRGSSHGSNEYPFLIDENGFSVLPITSLGLTAKVSDEHIATGIPDLDEMLEGKGYFKGSSVLITGSAGTGKTSFAAAFVREACRSGKKALFVTFEESKGQITRNMRSIGIDLEQYIDAGLLRIHADRPTSYGLEMHLVTLHRTVEAFSPEVVVIDPISSLINLGDENEVRSTLVRMVDYLKMRGITSVFTDLRHLERRSQSSLISSLADTWIVLEGVEANGEENRILRLVKSRGMAHSNQVREYTISDRGIDLTAPYIGPSGVLTGTARYTQEAKEEAEQKLRSEEIERLRMRLEHDKRALDAQIETLQANFKDKEAEITHLIADEELRRQNLENNRLQMRTLRTKSNKEGATNDR